MISRIRKSELARHGAIVFAGVALAGIFNFLYYILIGRRASIETYGAVTSLASALLVVSAPATVAQIIAARLAADLHAHGDNAALRTLSDRVTWWTVLAATVIVAVSVIFGDQLAAYLNLSSPAPVIVTAVGAALYTIVLVQRGVFQGAHLFDRFAISSSIDATVKVAVGVPLVTPLGASGALSGMGAGLALAMVYNLSTFRSFGTARAPISLDRGIVGRVVSHVGLGQCTFTILMFYDVPLMKHAFDARSAGLYAAAALVGRTVSVAMSFVPTIIMPKATKRAASGISPLPLLGAAAGIGVAIAGAAIVAALIAPATVVTFIAGSRFSNAAPLVLAYTIASGALSLANIVAAYKMGLHQYDFVVPASLVGLAEVVVLAIWHPSLTAAVLVLLFGHCAVLASTLFRLNASVPKAVYEAGTLTLSS